MNLWIIVLCALLAACARPVFVTPVQPPTPSPAGQLTASPAPLDQRSAMAPAHAGDVDHLATATRYRIHLLVDASAAVQVQGRQEVQYTNVEGTPLEELYFRLFPATPGYGGAMTVTHVSLGACPEQEVDCRPPDQGEPPIQTYLEQAGSALRVPLVPPLQPGRRVAVGLDFVVSVPRDNLAGYAQLDYAQGILTLPNIYPLIPAYDQAGWHVELSPGYGDAVYSDMAFYEVDLQTPSGQSTLLATTGSCRSLPGAGSGQRWQCASGPARDFAIVLGEQYDVATQAIDGVTVRSFYLPEHAKAGQLALEQACLALQIFSRRFGPYPLAELDVVETPTTAGGIEYPGLVVIAANLYDDPQEFFEWVIAHEVSHQWWYNLVGNDQVNHPWLDEALAQYATILYFEEAHDQATGAYLVNSVFEHSYQATLEAQADAPVDRSVMAFTPATYGPLVYNKGALFFHALRQAMGEAKFDAFLQAYYRQHRYGIATPDSLLAVAQTVLDKPTLQRLYDEWIRGARRP